MNHLVGNCVVLIPASVLTGVDVRVAADDVTNTTERQAILNEMRSAVGAMTVSEKAGDAIVSAKVLAEPIFRYSDEPQQICDATLPYCTRRIPAVATNAAIQMVVEIL